jgi:uncharacterized protein
LIRLLIYAFMIYLGFKVIQKIVAPFFFREIPGSRPQPEVEADELVQDPVCKVFVPRRNALKAHKNGEDFFFCSEGCRKKFLK